MFVPLTPCRVVDSRLGEGIEGPLAPGVVHQIPFHGRCGIAGRAGGDVNMATAVAMNIIAVSPAGFGHITAWPSNHAMPTASLINYSPGQNLANGVIVPMCQLDCPTGDINFVAAVSAVHLVVDVTGYYIKPVETATQRHGAGPGPENFLCVNNLAGVRFGLSSQMAHKAEAGRLCPPGPGCASSARCQEAGATPAARTRPATLAAAPAPASTTPPTTTGAGRTLPSSALSTTSPPSTKPG